MASCAVSSVTRTRLNCAVASSWASLRGRCSLSAEKPRITFQTMLLFIPSSSFVIKTFRTGCSCTSSLRAILSSRTNQWYRVTTTSIESFFNIKTITSPSNRLVLSSITLRLLTFEAHISNLTRSRVPMLRTRLTLKSISAIYTISITT